MKLPEIFKNKLDDTIHNNEKIFISNDDRGSKDIFDNLPVKVIFNYKNGGQEKVTVVGKTKNYYITKDRNVIYASDIQSIKKI